MNTFDAIDRVIDNMLVAGAHREQARIERKQAAYDAAYRALRDELIDALTTEPTRIVRTPGAHVQTMPALDVIADDFAGRDGDSVLHELLLIAAAASTGPDPALRIRAQAWIAARADRHAEFHASDMGDE